MPRYFWLVMPLVCFGMPVQAEIFKCVAKDGTVLYQNFKCEVDSLGSLPSAPTLAKPVPVRETNAQEPKIVAAETAVNRQSGPSTGQVRIGMTTEQVRSIWGEPTETYQDELVEGRVEIWAYGSNRSVKFDLKGIATEIQP